MKPSNLKFIVFLVWFVKNVLQASSLQQSKPHYYYTLIKLHGCSSSTSELIYILSAYFNRKHFSNC